MKLFAIRDKATGEWYTTRRGKNTWLRRGPAKNAWNAGRSGKLKFDEAGTHEVVECVLVEKDTFDSLVEAGTVVSDAFDRRG